MVNIKGFGSRENELTELERKIGARFLEENKDVFSFYRNKAIRVVMGNNTFNGIYQGTTENGFLIMTPCLQREFYPLSPNKDQEGRTTYFWDAEPVFIRSDAVLSVIPTRKEYLDEIVRNNELVNNNTKEISL